MTSKSRPPLESRTDYSAVVPNRKGAVRTHAEERQKRIKAGPPPTSRSVLSSSVNTEVDEDRFEQRTLDGPRHDLFLACRKGLDETKLAFLSAFLTDTVSNLHSFTRDDIEFVRGHAKRIGIEKLGFKAVGDIHH